MIRVSGVSKSIHKNRILKNVHFSVRSGTITGVVGRNGAGKTTLLRIIAGILYPSSGEITVNDQNVFKQPDVKQNVVFVPDSTDALRTYSIKEIVKFYEEIYDTFDQEYFYQLLEKFKFTKQGKIKYFSKGQKALFSLILAFSTNAKYVLLDEPTDGLDVIIKKQILQFIAEAVSERDVSVVISSHRLDELEKMADHIVVLKQGKVDSELEMEELKSQYHKIQVAFEGKLPQHIRDRSEVLSETGRVSVLLISSKDEETKKMIEDAEPILYEELPLSLEDIFVAKLGGDLYVS
ncbi:ABC transporter ATP-binding protein [Tenuibacillus multivorans]|uniref:ABC-2 type transport system ATP-binding protein n=1 Tax=Tenuibacillus multivorans TaxID=237069 RepID=A0A1H0G5C6_9BACI|nr:ABC transporter ATP-binding protein [Tenuibacillus multivorans]GEL78808.1 ABC transporter ATP-binding protein [Tenuibacillus multivorans]SDO02044.1 ABC-2 type transport system ATP-binding protein [Tenuibacillus multivorans]